MSDDIKAMTGRLTAGFNDFKAEYAKRHAALDARMDELDLLYSNAEFRAKYGTTASPRAGEAEKAAFVSAVLKRDLKPGEAHHIDLTTYEAALRDYVRLGPTGLAPDVMASMSVGSDPAGGYFVPGEFLRMIKTRLFETSPVRQHATILTTASDHVEFPVDNADLTSGGWVSETATRSETTAPQIAMQSIYVHENFAMPAVTQKLLEMAAIPVEPWLSGKIADRLGRQQNTAFVLGDGVGQPRGFNDYTAAATTQADSARAWGVHQYVPTGASGAFATLTGDPAPADVSCLVTAVHSMKAEHRKGAIWAMNSASAGVVRKLHDGDGRLVWADSLINGQPDRLLGYPVVIMEDMADFAADSFPIVFANFKEGYTILDGPSYKLLRDPYTTKGLVKFYATAWTGGDVVNSECFKWVKAGTS